MAQINVFLARLSSRLHLDVGYFLKGGIWLALPTVTNQLLGLLRSIAFVHLTSQAIYGQFSFVLALVGLFSIFTLPGMNIALAQTVARGNLGALLPASRERAVWGILATLCTTGAALYYFWIEKETTLAIAIFIAGVFLPISAALSNVQGFFQGRKQFSKVSQVRVGLLICNFISIIAVLWWQAGIIWLIVVQSASQVIFYGAYFRVASREARNQVSDPEMISYGRSLTGAALVTTVATQLDRVILGFSADFVSVAIYAIAQILPNSLKGLMKMTIDLVLPKIAEQPDKQIYVPHTKKMLLLLLGLNLLVVVGAMIITPWILTWLYTDQYVAAIPFAQLLFLSLAVSLPGSFFSAALHARKQTQAIYRSSFVYGFLLIGALIMTVPYLGILGIVLSRIVARWCITCYQWWLVMKL